MGAGHAQLKLQTATEPTPEDIARGAALTEAAATARVATLADPAEPRRVAVARDRYAVRRQSIRPTLAAGSRDAGSGAMEAVTDFYSALRFGVAPPTVRAMCTRPSPSEFHETDAPGRCFCTIRALSRRSLTPVTTTAPRAPVELRFSVQLSLRDARLELVVLQARYFDAGPAEERGWRSRPLSGRGRRALRRRLPCAEEHLWRRTRVAGLWRRAGRRHKFCTKARWRRAQRH